MGLFFKKQYDILEFPFRFDNTLDQKESEEALFIDLIFLDCTKINRCVLMLLFNIIMKIIMTR